MATIFSGIVIRALDFGLGQNGVRRRQELIIALASIHKALSVISFNPKSDGLSLMDVT
jgi:hypothetical protein